MICLFDFFLSTNIEFFNIGVDRLGCSSAIDKSYLEGMQECDNDLLGLTSDDMIQLATELYGSLLLQSSWDQMRLELHLNNHPSFSIGLSQTMSQENYFLVHQGHDFVTENFSLCKLDICYGSILNIGRSKANDEAAGNSFLCMLKEIDL